MVMIILNNDAELKSEVFLPKQDLSSGTPTSTWWKNTPAIGCCSEKKR